MTPEDMAATHARAMTSTSPWSADDFRQLLSPPGTFLVTQSPSQSQSTAAFALGRIIFDEAELLTLAVDPDFQRQGLGRACLAAFEAEAISRGAQHLHLEVAATNVAAISLYSASGWQKAGQRKAYYKSDTGRIDAILMSKRLNPD